MIADGGFMMQRIVKQTQRLFARRHVIPAQAGKRGRRSTFPCGSQGMPRGKRSAAPGEEKNAGWIKHGRRAQCMAPYVIVVPLPQQKH
jgi:hypothetical protein